MNKILFIFFFGLRLCQAAADSSDYYSAGYLRYKDFVYRESIRSVTLHPPGDDQGEPILELNKDGQLVLDFDDFDFRIHDYRFTFIHCDFNWNPSDLLPSQVLQGFTEDRITNYGFSVNTIQKFVHYKVNFPDQDMLPMISGNYILLVYEEGNQENRIITRRFRVYERMVGVSANIHRATIVSDRDSRQEVDFSIEYPNYRIDDVYTNLKVVVVQNDRPDNVISNLKPLFVRDKALDYNYDKENVFDGGNEFRYFDIRTLKFQTERVNQIIYDSLNRVVLTTDPWRNTGPYSVWPDINGKFSIKVRDKNNSDLEADYVLVYFTLPADVPLNNGNFYVFGQLSDWQFKTECRMRYDVDSRMYTAGVYLKQGYYNYEYVFLKDGSEKGDETLVEGNHFETENFYSIYVYDKPMGSRYDHLIGYQRYNTKSFY